MQPAEIDLWPYPIAFPLARMENPRLPALTRLNCLVDTFRAVLKFGTLCAVSDYTEVGYRDTTVDDLIRERFLAQNSSLGHWVELLREVARFHARRAAEPPFVRELAGALFPNGKPGPALEVIGALVHFRNQWIAHGTGTPGESEAAALLAQRRPQIDALLRDFSFLTRYLLLVPEEVTGGDACPVITRYVTCRGPRPPLLPEATTALPTRPGVRRGETLLLAREGSLVEHIALFPLWIPEYEMGDEAYDLYAFEATHRTGRDLAIQRLVYHPTRQRQPLDVTPDTPWAMALDAFVGRFGRVVSSIMSGRAAPARAPLAARDHYFPAQRELIARYRRAFVGREAVVATLGEHLSGAASCLLVVGPPGQGKTACLAHLVGSHGWAHHFFSRDGGRHRHALAMRSLLQQVIEQAILPISVPEDLAELERAWAEVWGRVPPGVRVVVALDALDESDLVDETGALDLLVPPVLPAGVRFLVSARPGRLADALASRPGTRTQPLGPLTGDDVRRLLLARGADASPERVQALLECTEGNPLFLTVQLDEAGCTAGRHVRARVEDCFRARLDRTVDALGADPVHCVVGTLAAAQSALSPLEIGRLTPSVDLLRLRRTLAALGEFLTSDGGRFRFFHKRFEDFVRDEYLGDAGLREFHRRIAASYLVEPLRCDAYGLRYLCPHLAAAGEREELRRVLTPAFLGARWKAEGEAADFVSDARAWLGAGLEPGELLDRLCDVAAGAEALLARKVVRCFGDLGAVLPREPLLAALGRLPAATDFWVGSEVRKVVARLSPRSAEGSRPRIRIGLLNYIGHLPFFLAREVGLFERAGLDVDLVFFDGHEDRHWGVTTGQVDGLATTLDEVLLCAEDGTPLRVVLRLSREGTAGEVVDGILTRHPVGSVEDLRGMRVAVEKDSPSLFVLHHVLRSHGLPPGAVKLAFFRSSDDAGAALRDPTIDAAVLWEPWLQQAQRDSGGTILPVGDIDVVEDVLAFRVNVLAERRDIVARLCAVWHEMVASLSEHEEDFVRLARERFGVDAGEGAALSAKLQYAGLEANRTFFAAEAGPSAFVREVEYAQDVLQEAGLLSRRWEPDELAGYCCAI